MLNQKGQESAPFELLIAVIVMTFVIMIGLQATDTLVKEQCKGQIESGLERMKTGIESVVKGKGKENVSFNLPTCFEEKRTKIRIAIEDSAKSCAYLCGGSQQVCTLLIYSNPQFNSIKCLYISPHTIFPTGDPCDAEDIAGEGEYEAVDLKGDEGIKPGHYILISKFSSLSQNPIICAFRKTR